ncbi:MAG: PEP-CTERM sorting domain-containing protein [Planctomycetota bacterium]
MYTAGGWTVSHPNNEPFEFATFGTQEGRYPGSTALFNNTIGGVITFERINGGAFDMESIDIANLNNGGPVTVQFTGNLEGGGQVFGSYTTTGPTNILETYVFPNAFTNLVSHVWTQDAPFHQFDNITIIPAPGVLALLGLGGLAAGRRRRRV